MHKLTKTLAGAALATGMSLGAALAADWTPDGPVTMHVGFGAGGSTDALSRAIAKSVEDANGWDVVVENLPVPAVLPCCPSCKLWTLMG